MTQRVVVTTSYDDIDKEADGSDEEYVTAAGCDFKRQARQPNQHFEKLLESAYLNLAYQIKHKFKECTMIKNFMTTRALTKGKKREGDPGAKAIAPFPREEAVKSIYDRPIPHESRCKLRLTNSEVNAVSLATLEYR
jgi:hypothetical protein